MSHQLLLATGDDRGDGVDGSVWGKVTGNSLLPAISMIGREFKLMISLNSTQTPLSLHWYSLPELNDPLSRKGSTKGPYLSFKSIQTTMDYKRARHFMIGEIVDQNFGKIISEWSFGTEVSRSAAPFSQKSVPNLVPTKGRLENSIEHKRIRRRHSRHSVRRSL